LLALRHSQVASDRVLAGWPSSAGALIEHRQGLPNWTFHALALFTRLTLGEASAVALQPLANALVQARGVAVKSSPHQRQNNSLQGWSWVDGTFSWAEPTAWGLVALKTYRACGVAVQGSDRRIQDGEAILRDRMCVTGGWNYGNSNVFGQNLPAYIPTTAIGLLALQDRGHENFVRHSLDYLEERAETHPSTRALALSTIALRRHGRSATAVEGALRAWLTKQPAADVASRAIALCALNKDEGDDAFAY
jgi:hypothetical protein